jgi:hypothetical protein
MRPAVHLRVGHGISPKWRTPGGPSGTGPAFRLAASVAVAGRVSGVLGWAEQHHLRHAGEHQQVAEGHESSGGDQVELARDGQHE